MTQLNPSLLLQAYAIGIFPMAANASSPELYWFDPEDRGVLPLDGFHLPKRLKRTVKQGRYSIRLTSDFDRVIGACAAPGRGRHDTWINAEIRDVYSLLARAGHAHSVEVWSLGGDLIGGLYGVALGGAFFGESMFTRARDASKVCLVHLVDRLRAGGFSLLDTQWTTDHLKRFGAMELPRPTYLAQLRRALQVKANFFAWDEVGDR